MAAENLASKRILVADPIAEEGIEVLRQHAQVDVKPGLTDEELIAIIGEYDALVVRSATQVTLSVINAGSRLQAIGRAGTGTDNIDLTAATRRGIVVVNAPTANTIAAAEHTIALMTALARNIPQADASLRAGRWERKRFIGVELRDKMLGIIGLGRIGSEVAKRAQGLAMHVVAYDPFVSAEYATRLGVQLLPLGELLGLSDFISLHTPLTKSTRGLIGARALALVKPGARLINCARGPLVDEEALLAALHDGRLAGAALDVFPHEPPFGSRLTNHPKVIVTPHLGASTAEAQAGVARDVAQQIIAVLQGRITEHAVNAPLVSPETLEALIPYIRLVECLGQFYTQVGEGRMERVRVIYSGELATYDTTPLKAAVVKGLLEPVSEERINLVNAHLVARRRGLEIVEEKTTHVSHYTDMVALEVTTDQGVRSVAGTVLRDEPHIVRIDNYWLDVVARGCLLVCHNQDRPGVIGQVGTVLGEADVNIAFMQVGRETPRGEAIMILGLDDTVPPGVYDRLRRVPGLFDVRVVHL